MLSYLRLFAATSFLTTFAVLTAAQSGSGTTTRYWDCCKPSCGWNKGGVTAPVKTCDVNDQPLSDQNAQSGCNGGNAFMCSDQSPWAISDTLAYGFAAVSSSNAASCCACYQLTFTSTAIAGKKMIVQATNTGGDVASTQFDLAIPGGGFGIFDGCSSEWKATTAIWGAQYGGQASVNTCSQFPTALQPGCNFRWDWMQGVNGSNPNVDYEMVTCPAELVAKSGCSVTGYSPQIGSAPAPSSSAALVAVKENIALPPSTSLNHKPAFSVKLLANADGLIQSSTASIEAPTSVISQAGPITPASSSEYAIPTALSAAKKAHHPHHHHFHSKPSSSTSVLTAAATPESVQEKAKVEAGDDECKA